MTVYMCVCVTDCVCVDIPQCTFKTAFIQRLFSHTEGTCYKAHIKYENTQSTNLIRLVEREGVRGN